MKEQTTSKLLFVLIAISLLNQSCAILVKNQINKKYPSVNTIDKKIQTVCNNIKEFDSTSIFDASISIKKFLIDTILSKTLKDKTKQIIFNESRIDSLVLNNVNAKLGEQEIILTSDQKMYFNYKRLKNIEYSISASTSPYFSQDTLYFNPYFNAIKIKKIKFRFLGFLTKRKVIYSFLNKIIETHLSNLNGQVRNYNVNINSLPKDSILVSKLVNKNDELIIEKDALLIFQKQTPNFVFNVNLNSLNLLLQFNNQYSSTFKCPQINNIPYNEKALIFKQLYSHLINQFKYVEKNNFDSLNFSENSLITIKIRNGYLASNLNNAFNNIDFKFKININFAELIQRTLVYIPRPSLSCPNWKWCLLKPDYCTACVSAQKSLSLLPSRIRAGSIGGNIGGSGTIFSNLKSINFDEHLSSVQIDKDLNFNGKLNYDLSFNGFDGIGFVLTCNILQFKGNPTVTGGITNPKLNSKIIKENTSTNCNIKLAIDPIKYKVKLSPPPVIDIFTNIRNSLTCNAGMTVLGIGFGLGTIAGKLFDLGEVETVINVATTGKYDSELKLKEITYPIEYSLKTRYGNYILKSSWGNKSINVAF